MSFFGPIKKPKKKPVITVSKKTPSENSTPAPTPRKVLRPKVVMDRTGYSRVQLWRKSRNPDDDFPLPVKLGGNAIGWFETEIEAWLATRPRLSPAPAQAESGA